jgi:hypothetical protein
VFLARSVWSLCFWVVCVYPCLSSCSSVTHSPLFLSKDILCYTWSYRHLSRFLPCGFWCTLSHPSDFIKKSCWVPISVFLVLYKPATSPCGWKPEWKKRGHSKNNHTYTNTLTYGTTTLRSSFARRHGDGVDWHVLSFVTCRHNCIQQRKSFQFHDILLWNSKSVI